MARLRGLGACSLLLGVLACDSAGAGAGDARRADPDGGDTPADGPRITDAAAAPAPDVPIPAADVADPAADAAAADLATGPVGITLAELPAAIGRVICAKRFTCCSADERARAGFAPDEATCAMRFARAFGLLLPELERSVAAGRAAYDGPALAACLDAYQALPCPDARMNVPFAISVAGCPYLRPRIEQGAACGQSFECRDGWCAGVGFDHDGQCAVKKPNGAACLTLDECVGGFCDLDAEVCGPPPRLSVCQSAG